MAARAKLEVLTREPQGPRRQAPLVFVHGAYVGAWCWAEYFLPWFAERGWAVHAVSLRGHGASGGRESLDMWSLEDYVEDVASMATELGRPPVLVGHSMGAIVAQRAARRCNAPAIVLMAPVPPQGLSTSVFSLALRDPPLFVALNAMQLGADDVSTLRRVRDFLFSASVSEADVRRYLRRTQRESKRALFELAWPQHFWIAPSVGLPCMVIAGADDAFFPTALMEEAARFHGVTAQVLARMAHVMMLEPEWEQAAQRVHSWLETAVS
jgi:pimeloyl-ACP methyl ester carboxylesterase